VSATESRKRSTPPSRSPRRAAALPLNTSPSTRPRPAGRGSRPWPRAQADPVSRATTITRTRGAGTAATMTSAPTSARPAEDRPPPARASAGPTAGAARQTPTLTTGKRGCPAPPPRISHARAPDPSEREGPLVFLWEGAPEDPEPIAVVRRSKRQPFDARQTRQRFPGAAGHRPCIGADDAQTNGGALQHFACARPTRLPGARWLSWRLRANCYVSATAAVMQCITHYILYITIV
jgi:hypothetical protein